MNRIATLLTAVIAAAGCTGQPPLKSTCDVVIGAVPSGSELQEGAPMPADAVVLARPGDIDWEGSRLGAGDQGDTRLLLQLHPEASRRVADFTRDNVGALLPIALAGQVVSAPVIVSALDGGQIEIQGGVIGAPNLDAFRPCFQ